MPPPPKVKEIHHTLLGKLDRTFSPGSDDFIWLKRQARSFLLPGVVDRCKNMNDLLDRLQGAGTIKIGEYTELKEMMRVTGCNVGDAIETIEEAEADIQKIYDAQSETKPKYTKVKEESEDHMDSTSAGCPNTGYLLQKSAYNKGKGFCLILNFFRKERPGTKHDMENLTSFLTSVNCDVREEPDLSRKDVLETLKYHQGYLQRSMYEYFICAIMSHGDEKGIITCDGKEVGLCHVTMTEIMDHFRNDQMAKFVGKPKIFLVQACRGKDLQKGHDVSDDEFTDISTMIGETKIPTDADVLLVHATTPGYKAWRRVYEGSWFFCELVKLLKTHYTKEHLEEMLISLRENVALNYETTYGAKQMPCTWSTLTKRFYFQPSPVVPND